MVGVASESASRRVGVWTGPLRSWVRYVPYQDLTWRRERGGEREGERE